MKLFFINESLSRLSACEATILDAVRNILILRNDVEEVFTLEKADAIIIQERNSYKDFRYIKELKSDTSISAYPEKVFTINTDDCATGILRGLYTSLPKIRFNPSIYTSVPFMEFPNDLVFSNDKDDIALSFLASWRGNTKSNKLRSRMVKLLEKENRFSIQKTDSWLNHDMDEKKSYTDLIRASKFSLCPAGWAPVSFRIYESMALARCPVIIADDFVPPKGPKWKDFALFYPEKKIADLPSFLLCKEHLAEDYGKNALKSWQTYFSFDVIKEYYANALLSLIQSTPNSTKEAEFKRWKSFELHWNNKWTLGQRALNRFNRLVKKT